MSYMSMYVLFGILFFAGVIAYWWVTNLFRNDELTYERSADDQKA